ncbi:glycosyltransferase family 2 protein [Candidatus Woesebacteria bacterium]|nr:glycosyltransferase family 2 protein [Candidatus Woesebacteria bacterium]
MAKSVLNVSVIIATRDRPKDLYRCIYSLLKSEVLPFEIIVIDQSKSDKTKKIVQKKNSPIVKYYKVNYVGKSRSLNDAISRAKGNILAFTDDDCVIDIRWIKQISEFFQKNEKESIVFGNTKPFILTKKKDMICPATFSKENDYISYTKNPCKHWEEIGFGNNMSFRKNIFNQVIKFETLLGPGSIGRSAEDAEIANKCLLLGHKIAYNPFMVIYHNRWISTKENRNLYLSYSLGGTACYSSLLFNGNKFSKDLIKNEFKNIYYNFIAKEFLIKVTGLMLGLLIYLKQRFNLLFVQK